MRNVQKTIISIIILLNVVLMTSCFNYNDGIYITSIPNATEEFNRPEDNKDYKEEDNNKENEKPEKTPHVTAIIPVNETITSMSPNKKYCAEAYGTNTKISAGRLYPYEGIRIINEENNDIIWELKPVGYTVSFSWSPNSQFVGIYYTSRIDGDSIVVDVETNEPISLPSIDKIVSHYGYDAKPREVRPDLFLKVKGWEDSETVIVDFSYTKTDGDLLSGQYYFNVITSQIVFK